MAGFPLRYHTGLDARCDGHLCAGIISVLKIFDLVLVVAPEPVRADATVLALEMWNAAFGGMNDHGLGSALATILFLLILPVMLSNIRRFRLDQQ